MGGYIVVKAVIKDKSHVELINIYAPNKDKDLINFFKNLFEILQKENQFTISTQLIKPNYLVIRSTTVSLDPYPSVLIDCTVVKVGVVASWLTQNQVV